MTLRSLHLVAVTALSLGLVATAGCAAKQAQADTRPMAPGAEQGGAGSDGTNSVTDAKAEEEADAPPSEGAADAGGSAATGGVSSPP